MILPVFSLKSLLPSACASGRQRSLVFSAAAELAPRPLPRGSYILAVPVLSLRSTGIPENTRAALPKSSIRSKTGRIIYFNFVVLAGGLAVLLRGVRGTRAGTVAPRIRKSGRARVRRRAQPIRLRSGLRPECKRRTQFCHAGAKQASPQKYRQDTR